ncbi:MAG: 3-deoxy-8-phosphooctulonate synthase [Candidatus Omnitrophica bacterium]|nr:3-deoxy-8-phosphooctulonate synthase [Candidatus Omnitrophota bacterium]
MLNYKNKFIFIAGPCVIEDKALTLDIAAQCKDITSRYSVLFVFKASFDKANRTSVGSYRGPGLTKGVKILEEIKKKYSLPILSDVHCTHQIKQVKDVLDVIQIPAFLSRQTDLILEVAKTKKIVNIKKAQFMAPNDMVHVIKKIESTGNKKILLTERGSCFGYNNLVVDFRSFLTMKQMGFPVIFDATHSLQRPSAKGGISGGDSEFVQPLANAAVACGVDGLFMEIHPNPKKALSDKHTSFSLKKLEKLLKRITKIREASK